MDDLCCICLKVESFLITTRETDKNSVKYYDKLKICVPEVEWIEDNLICQLCTKQLQDAYDFRNLCIQSGSIRENKLTDFCEDDNISICENTLKTDEEDCVICFHCNDVFSDKITLIEHIKSKHTVKIELEQNDKKVTPKAPRSSKAIVDKCEKCGQTFTAKYLLKRHLKNVHAEEKNYKCELCEQKFASPVYLSAHRRYHSGDRSYICSFCGKGFITASDLYHHEKIHADTRTYRCQKCPKAFKTSSDLHKHNLCVHTDHVHWKYACDFCQRRFPLKTNLDNHIKTHTGEKNFPCHLCDRKCINRSVLMRHVESHSNVRTFLCSLCGQDYKYQKSLDIHMKKIHGIGDVKIPERIKKHFCHVCFKSFVARNKLDKHIRSHTGERPFTCQICAKSFIDKSYVKQHLKTVHNFNGD